jgi:hypothetical protein
VGRAASAADTGEQPQRAAACLDLHQGQHRCRIGTGEPFGFGHRGGLQSSYGIRFFIADCRFFCVRGGFGVNSWSVGLVPLAVGSAGSSVAVTGGNVARPTPTTAQTFAAADKEIARSPRINRDNRVWSTPHRRPISEKLKPDARIACRSWVITSVSSMPSPHFSSRRSGQHRTPIRVSKKSEQKNSDVH